MRINHDPVDWATSAVAAAPRGPVLTTLVSDPSLGERPRRWRPPRLSTPTVAGIAVGVSLYLVVILSGNLLLGAGIALVLLLLVSLIRTVRQTRETRTRLREGQEDQR